jgi:DNA-binding NarL/FixJ family response regulator
MPGMDGKACLEKLQRLDPDVRALIASGYIQYELTDELQSLGAMRMV